MSDYDAKVRDMGARIAQLENRMDAVVDHFCNGHFDDAEPPASKQTLRTMRDLEIDDDDIPPFY